MTPTSPRTRKSATRPEPVSSATPPATAPVSAATTYVTPPAPVLPTATIARRAADRLAAGHAWVYASDVLRLLPSEPPAGLMLVEDQAGHFLGTALWSPTSQISLRLLTPDQLDHPAWLTLLKTRLAAAIADREPLLTDTTDSCRLVFSEADALPGIVLDKYGNIVILQLLAAALDQPSVRAAIIEVVRAELAPRTLVERPDPRIRELEQMPAPSLDPLYADTPPGADGADGEGPGSLPGPLLATVFHLNGLGFHYDASAGQKTGAFLDQRANYAAAAAHAHGEALDVCTYQGGFALHLATTCRRVTGLDTSQAALDVAERNLALNREALGAVEVDWVQGDAFAVLREWAEARAAYDTIVLDPPAFAKTQRAAQNAIRGYKELNLRSLQMLRPGGTLVTCSCSHHVSLADFEAVLRAAAADAGRRLRLLERRGAAPDHPVILNIPETEYLKCLILRVE